MAEEKENKIDETVPGGKYIVGDRFVIANGEDLGPTKKADLKVDSTAETEEETTDTAATARGAKNK